VIFDKKWRKNFSRKISIKILPTLIFVLMRTLWFSYRKKFHFIDKPIDKQCIAVSWHSELLVSPQAYRKLRKKQPTSAIVSRHFHGKLVEKVLNFFNIAPLRGSTNKGAREVLINSLRAIKNNESILLTPDGPKGPRYSMSDGAVALALKTKLPIMIINYQPTSYWQLKSWDRFLIPKPFTTINIYHQVIDFDNIQKKDAKKYLQLSMIKYSL
jgi:lysophospholipid acyltransferase (LPLAT)-like uncharacterized protein